ncbi:MAG: D-alanyl-D-alanine carboxypeptidase family protein [Sarcina sp.]
MNGKKTFLIAIIFSLLCSLFTYFPSEIALATDTTLQKPSIVGKSAITMDLKTGEIIYAKDIDTKRYPASITKLMTALVFAEKASKDSIIPYTESASKQPAYSLFANYGPIKIGDSLKASDVMNALLLFSANDAAYMIGDYVFGSNEEFIKLMNQRAKELGLKNTNFKNPNGLHDPEHYTTAYDLALMAKAMLENPWVKETISTKESQIEFIDSQKRINIENRNKILGVNGNIGGKTGYTIPAGRCLLTFYERDGRTLVGVVLNSEYGATDTQVFDDMNAIMDYSFAVPKIEYKQAGEIITEVEAKYKTFGKFGKEKSINIPISINSAINKYDNNLSADDISLTVDTKDLDAWDIAGNKKLKANFSEKGSIVPLTASAKITNFTIIKENFGYYAIRILGVFITLFIIFLLIRTFNQRKFRKRSFLGNSRKKKRNIFS